MIQCKRAEDAVAFHAAWGCILIPILKLITYLPMNSFERSKALYRVSQGVAESGSGTRNTRNLIESEDL